MITEDKLVILKRIKTNNQETSKNMLNLIEMNKRNKEIFFYIRLGEKNHEN